MKLNVSFFELGMNLILVCDMNYKKRKMERLIN